MAPGLTLLGPATPSHHGTDRPGPGPGTTRRNGESVCACHGGGGGLRARHGGLRVQIERDGLEFELVERCNRAARQAYKACMVLDIGGVDDRSFNQSSWKGMTDAKAANPNDQDLLRVVDLAERLHPEPQRRGRSKGCDTIDRGRRPDGRRGQGGRGRPTRRRSSPSSTPTPAGPNVYGLQFNTAQGAFLGGYLAAAMTQDRQGRDVRRPQHPAGHDLHGRLLGGRAVLQQAEGQERPGARLERERTRRPARSPSRSPTRTRASRSAQAFIQQGADVIFPVAGGTGLGVGRGGAGLAAARSA